MASRSKWPPNYKAEFIRRNRIVDAIQEDGGAMASAYYSTRPVEFINDLCFTVDPRRSGENKLTIVPFVLFPRQVELIHFFQQLILKQTGGLVEKSRDMGATWCSVAFSVWLWRFRPGVAIGFGSRKQMMVDRMGDMDSIFEKIRFTIRYLPRDMLPKNWTERVNFGGMKVINPENGASITGEAGDNIGRGGRKLIYFKDESAHYERPKKIEAALMDNTNVQVDMSSVNGPGNVFHRKRKAGKIWRGRVKKGKIPVFVMDWRDHPAKDRQWYDSRRAKAEDEGLLVEFAREIDRDYSASVAGTILKRQWVEAAVGLAEHIGKDLHGKRIAALDVADDGEDGDANAMAVMNGMELIHISSWGQVDTDLTARRAYGRAAELKAWELHYDSIGVGAGVKGTLNQMKREGEHKMEVVAWVASGAVRDPGDPVVKDDYDGPLNGEFFMNFKAQAWWNARNCFYNAWKARQGMEYDDEMLVSISPSIPQADILVLFDELCQPIRTESKAGKMVVDKSPNGSQSPNRADAVIMAMFPAERNEFITQEILI